MRFITRLAEPRILMEKKEEWTRNFLNSGKSRPDSNKYGHINIRDTLNTMSMHKCFYCERKLKNIPKEVDHYFEVAERRELSFEWDNLYLACHHCNGKYSNLVIPNAQTLNPCVDSDEEIMQHLTFEDEIIRPFNNSDKGEQTIKKYKLDSEELDHLRLVQIKLFHKVLLQIKNNCISENRGINEKEITVLKSFQQRDHAFSLMFKHLLSSNDIN